MELNAELVPFFAAPLTFACGLAGLYLRSWEPQGEDLDETRNLVNRTSALIATLSALVLGLLIASAHNLYNTQKTGLEVVSAKALQLDGLLRQVGPEAAPARVLLKSMLTESYYQIWENGHGVKLPPVQATAAEMDAMYRLMNGIRPQSNETQKYLLGRAGDIFASMGDQRVLMTLQAENTISWPFLVIMVMWTALLFFGFGLLAPINLTTVSALGVAALAVASGIFLIVELSAPYTGMLRISPAPVLAVIGELGK